MLRFFLLMFIIPSFVSAKGVDSLVFKEKSLSLGRIKIGEKRVANFLFSSEYSDKILILDVKTNCECTTAEYPKSPIVPFQNDTIKVVFDAKSKGVFLKKIDIYTSKNSVCKLSIVGEVVK